MPQFLTLKVFWTIREGLSKLRIKRRMLIRIRKLASNARRYQASGYGVAPVNALANLSIVVRANMARI